MEKDSMGLEIRKLRDCNHFRDLIFDSSKNYSSQIAFKYKKNPTEERVEEITYEQFGKDVKSFSTALLDLGLKQKRVIVIGNNRYEWCVSYLAVTTGNMIVAPLDKSLPENEILSLIRRSDADAVIFSGNFESTMLKAKQMQDSNVKILISMDKPEHEDIYSFSSLLEKGEELIKNGDKRYDEIKIDENEMSIMLFTSGTTSLSKIVMLSQKNICSNFTAYYNHFRLYPTDTLLSFLPIHHTFESSITFLYGVYCGVTIAFCDGLKYIQSNLKEYKVSVFVAVPLVMETMYKRIMKIIDEKGKSKAINFITKISNGLLKIHIDIRKNVFKQILDQLGGNLRVVLYGAAAMDVETIHGFNNWGIELIQGYGLTETSPVLAAESERLHKPGSIGYPLWNVEIRMKDPDENGEGEIQAKGPNIMLGYYGNEEKTKEVLQDGWFTTGDYGYIDKDGCIFITGRKNDLIVLRNGKNVYPQELELLINKLPYVAESMVYSRDESKTDTMLCAKIVYDKDMIKESFADAKEEEYHELVWKQVKEINQTVPSYKHIKSIIMTDEPMEKTTTQKVKRFVEINKLNAEGK